MNEEKLDWLSKGKIYYDRSNYDQALRCYCNALTIDPQNRDAQFMKGRILLRKSMFSDAMSCFNKVLDDHPEDRDALLFKGNILYRKSKKDEAMQCYERILKSYSSDQHALLWKGKILREDQKYKEALTCYVAAWDKEPRLSQAFQNICEILMILGKYDDVVGICERALEYSPDDLTADFIRREALKYKSKLNLKQMIN